VLTPFSISFVGERGKPVLDATEFAGTLFFGIMGTIVKVAPLAAFGAMAFTVGKRGLRAEKSARADARLLPHRRLVRRRGSRVHRPRVRLLDLPLHGSLEAST
jgi:hypothetical protein